MNSIVTTRQSLVPTTITEMELFAEKLSKSILVPKDYQGKPANCFVLEYYFVCSLYYFIHIFIISQQVGVESYYYQPFTLILVRIFYKSLNKQNYDLSHYALICTSRIVILTQFYYTNSLFLQIIGMLFVAVYDLYFSQHGKEFNTSFIIS